MLYTDNDKMEYQALIRYNVELHEPGVVVSIIGASKLSTDLQNKTMTLHFISWKRGGGKNYNSLNSMN